jgi:hypothetical protein
VKNKETNVTKRKINKPLSAQLFLRPSWEVSVLNFVYKNRKIAGSARRRVR